MGRLSQTVGALLVLQWVATACADYAQARFIFTVPGAPPYKLVDDLSGDVLATDATYQMNTGYVAVFTSVEFNLTSSAGSVLDQKVSFDAGQTYTMIFMGTPDAVQLVQYVDDNAEPAAGMSGVRFIQACSNVGVGLDIYVDGQCELANMIFTAQSVYEKVGFGSYSVMGCNTGTNNCPIGPFNVFLPPTSVVTVILIGLIGSTTTPPNLLWSYDFYSPPAGVAQLRVLNTVVNGSVASIAASDYTGSLGVVATQPTFQALGIYNALNNIGEVNVTFNATLNNGESVAINVAPNNTQYWTLLSYGGTDAQPASLLALEDESAPVSATPTLPCQLRVVHAATGAPWSLQLTANGTVLAANVTYGVPGAYFTAPAGSVTIDAVEAVSGTTLGSLNLVLVPGTVATIYVLPSAPGNVVLLYAADGAQRYLEGKASSVWKYVLGFFGAVALLVLIVVVYRYFNKVPTHRDYKPIREGTVN